MRISVITAIPGTRLKLAIFICYGYLRKEISLVIIYVCWQLAAGINTEIMFGRNSTPLLLTILAGGTDEAIDNGFINLTVGGFQGWFVHDEDHGVPIAQSDIVAFTRENSDAHVAVGFSDHPLGAIAFTTTL